MAVPLALPPAIHVGDRPALVRVVIDLPRGARMRAGERDVEALDAGPLDGRAVVRALAPGLAVRRAQATLPVAGGTVVVGPRRNGFTVLARAPRATLKFVSYRVAPGGRRLVIDLWRNTTSAAARIRSDGCLRIDAWNVGVGRVRAQGRELQPLFEHGLVLTLRREGSVRTIALTPVTAVEGTFRSDFSGYASPGRWNGGLRFALAAPAGDPRLRAMLEAWSTSAKDGSLDCLVQTPVILGAQAAAR